CREDEFLVVDTWNADEERSVRTLSGGETFLASLALALALADQVRSLSTTDRARLDSLFLDEGFGTLDQETLRTVVDAIGQHARLQAPLLVLQVGERGPSHREEADRLLTRHAMAVVMMRPQRPQAHHRVEVRDGRVAPRPHRQAARQKLRERVHAGCPALP